MKKNDGKDISFIWLLAGLIVVPIGIGVAIANHLSVPEPDLVQRLEGFALGVEIGSNIIGGVMLLLGIASYLIGFYSSIKDEYKKEVNSFPGMLIGAFLISYSPVFTSIEIISVTHQIIAFIVLLMVAVFQLMKRQREVTSQNNN